MDASAAVPTDPKTWADVIHELSAMNATLQWMLFAAFVLWLLAWRGFAWWDKRQNARRQEQVEGEKAARSAQFNENISRLCVLLEQHTSDEESNVSSTNRSLAALSGGVETLARTIRDLRDRMSQTMSKRDSLTAIEDKLMDGVRAEVSDIFEQSLRRNDYARRADFIRSRVKTAVGDVLDRARRKLQTEYALSVDPAPFFPTRESEDGGTRHVLCDALWERMEPLYRVEQDADRKVEEMRVLVENLVSDTIARGREEVTDLYRETTPPAGAAR